MNTNALIMPTNMAKYLSNSQNARVITESYIGENGFCPSCGSSLIQTKNNSKAKDFNCKSCTEEFELKAKSSKIGNKIVNGAYSTLYESVANQKNLNLYVLQYHKTNYSVENLLVIPRYFFTPDLIEKRNPLGENARRAGWVGCNILISKVPEIGRIYYVKNRQVQKPEIVIANWQSTKFVNESKNLESRGWLLDTLNCVERIGKNEFSLDEIYAFEAELSNKHPNNNFIKDKLRQQLQNLRDKGVIEFLGRGRYRRIV